MACDAVFKNVSAGRKILTTCKSRWMWLTGAVILGLTIVGICFKDAVTEFRLKIIGVDIIALKTEEKVNVGFRCRNQDMSLAIDLIEEYLNRHSLAIDTVFVHDPVGDRGFEKICQMKRMSSIDGLSVYSRRISSNGLKSVEVAKEATRIVLQCPNVDCVGIQYVVRMASLKRVDLTTSSVSDECLGSLAKLRALEVLCLTETQISETAIHEFEKERPDVGVIH